MNNWVVWLIFGLLIVGLVGFLVFSFIKDKRKNKKIIQKRIELRRATAKTSKELAIRIYTLIEMNDEFLKEVQPGFSKVKMKNVNATSRNFLKEIYDSKAFKTLYIESDEADPMYSKNIKNLIDTSSNLWTKYCQEEILYFKKFHDELKGDAIFEIIKNEAKNTIRANFDREVKNNEFTK